MIFEKLRHGQRSKVIDGNQSLKALIIVQVPTDDHLIIKLPRHKATDDEGLIFVLNIL